MSGFLVELVDAASVLPEPVAEAPMAAAELEKLRLEVAQLRSQLAAARHEREDYPVDGYQAGPAPRCNPTNRVRFS